MSRRDASAVMSAWRNSTLLRPRHFAFPQSQQTLGEVDADDATSRSNRRRCWQSRSPSATGHVENSCAKFQVQVCNCALAIPRPEAQRARIE